VLARRESESKVVWYESPLLASAGLPHAFSTRLGGVSPRPFDSLSFGNPAGAAPDVWENIQENYRRLQTAIGAADRKVLRVHQMHGCGVLVARQGIAWDMQARADAVVASEPDCLASVRVADCTPVLLATADGRAVAAVHAGWRGVVAGVVPRAVDELRKIAPNARLIAAIGPCIGMEAFEVGAEVLEAFGLLLGERAPIRSCAGGKGRVDLRCAVALQLQDAGLSPENIDMTDRCTVEHAAEFFSHRRDQGVTGRMVAIIGARS